VIGTPLFKKLTLNLENGRKFIIDAPASSEQNFYITSAQLNEKPLTKNWISHSDIQNGGSLRFQLGASPQKSRGTDAASAPYSFSTNEKGK
jgi:putative alpha-1,2-mannosidase